MGAIVAFSSLPSVPEFLRLFRQRTNVGIVLPTCSPYSHLAWAASYTGLPAIVVDDPAAIRPGECAYLDGDKGALLYPTTSAERHVLQEDQAARAAVTREIASRATLPAVSRSGVVVRVLAQIQSAEDVVVARESGADGVGEIKSELLDGDGGEASAASVVRSIRANTTWTEIPIRFFDLDVEKTTGRESAEAQATNLIRRGVRIAENDEALVARFRTMLETIDLAGVVVVLPMITLPSEVERFRRRLGDLPVRIGVLVETPAAAVSMAEFLHVTDYFEIGTNDLSQFTMAWDRTVPNQELLPADRLARPVEHLISGLVRSVAASNTFVSLAVDLPPTPRLVQQILQMGVVAVAVPPRSIPLWKECVRLAQ